MFFGLDEEFEETEKLKWLDRRKRLMTRKYGELKTEYINSVNETPVTQISQVSHELLFVFFLTILQLLLTMIRFFSRTYYSLVEILMNEIAPVVFDR